MEFQSAPIKGVLGRELLPSAGRASCRLRQGEGEATMAIIFQPGGISKWSGGT